MFRDFDQSTLHDTSSVISSSHNKDYYKKNKISGQYKDHDPITGQLTQQGQFLHGLQVGLWKVYDQEGDEQHFRYREERVGARCQDGSYSSATGRGACSWHGGVAEWLHENKRYPVGGTGKYEPIETRLQRAKERLRHELKINTMKNDEELFLQVANKLLKINLNPQLQQKQVQQKVTAKLSVFKSQYQTQLSQLQQTQAVTQQQNLKLKQQIEHLKQKLVAEQKPTQKHEQRILNIKIQYDEKLQAKQKQILQLRRELKETKIKGEKDKKKLDLSVSKADSENAEIKNQIKMIQKQLAMLDKTVEAKEKREFGYEDNEGVSDCEGSFKYGKKGGKLEDKKQRPQSESKKQETKLSQPKIQANPNQPSKPILKPKPSGQFQSLNTSQQSHIPPFPQEQPSINSSLSYSKILNSKLFLDQNNKSDLSFFVDIKSTSKKLTINSLQNDKLNESRTQQRRMFRFKEEEQSSDQEVALRTDEEEDSEKEKEDENQEKDHQEEENLEIFKSIPFKASGIEVRKEEDSKISKKNK